MYKKSSKKGYILASIILILLFAVFSVTTFLSGRVKMNPEGTIGNTAGNLNNGGLFCEYDGTVYFSNSYDNGSLYAMTPDEGNLRKLNDSTVSNILAGGKYLYYYRDNATTSSNLGRVQSADAFIRSDLKGNNVTSITKDMILSGQLVDNYLYLLAAGPKHPEFYKIKIDKTEKVVLADYIINPACAVNGTIYYNGTEDNHYLYGLDTATDTSRKIWDGNIWNPIVNGEYVYYMDVSENYRLCRYSMAQNAIEVLTEERVDLFNVGSGYIYYQTSGETSQLKCMRTDGSEAWVIADGVYTNINLTSQYVYFQEFRNETSMYHSYIGSNSFDSFTAARDAVVTQ